MVVEDVRWASPLAEEVFASVDRGYGDAVAAWVSDRACVGWVAEVEGVPQGFAIIGGMGVAGRSHVLELLAIVVDPGVRRSGIGRHLLAAVLQEAKRTGVRKVWLNVAASNTPALGLFRQAGFRTERADDGQFANGETAQRLEWTPRESLTERGT
jgi:ribosomal protein S18 acetylase RimI-like enzyme